MHRKGDWMPAVLDMAWCPRQRAAGKVHRRSRKYRRAARQGDGVWDAVCAFYRARSRELINRGLMAWGRPASACIAAMPTAAAGSAPVTMAGASGTPVRPFRARDKPANYCTCGAQRPGEESDHAPDSYAPGLLARGPATPRIPGWSCLRALGSYEQLNPGARLLLLIRGGCRAELPNLAPRWRWRSARSG